jgi:hypothetical protein
MLKVNVSVGILFSLVFLVFCNVPIAVAAPEIIGAPKCKACHRAKTGDQWTIWTESAHAGAFETLASEESKKIAAESGLGDPQTEDACLKCHATGPNLGSDVVVNDKAKYSHSEGVGCESCHGPGSDYKSSKVMKDPEAARAAGLIAVKTAEGCTQCHNEESPTFLGFDFEQRWAEIAHPVPSGEEDQSAPVADELDLPDEISYPSSVGDVLFTHSKHAMDQGIECVECHHQIHADDLVTPHPDYMASSWVSCKTCHDTSSTNSEKYYRCSVCHLPDPDDISDETLSSKVVTHMSCWNCHESGTGVDASRGCGECHVKTKD